MKDFKKTSFNSMLGPIAWMFLFLPLISWASIDKDPVDIIKAKDEQLQKLLKENRAKKGTHSNDTLKVLINSIFDFQKLAEKSLGSEWKKISEDQQKRFMKAFKGMVENASVKKLEVYEADSTVYKKPKVRKKKATVEAIAFNKGVKTILEYKMHVLDGEWKAWDLVIDDLSTMRNYREQFKTILGKKDIEHLIKVLEKKAKEESKASTDTVKAKSEKKAAK